MVLAETPSERWIDGFLSNRRQRVVLNREKSCWKDVKSGVPQDQGSILGPLLFLIYVIDMPKSISSHVFLFADDTKLIRTISTLADQVAIRDRMLSVTRIMGFY